MDLGTIETAHTKPVQLKTMTAELRELETLSAELSQLETMTAELGQLETVIAELGQLATVTAGVDQLEPVIGKHSQSLKAGTELSRSQADNVQQDRLAKSNAEVCQSMIMIHDSDMCQLMTSSKSFHEITRASDIITQYPLLTDEINRIKSNIPLSHEKQNDIPGECDETKKSCWDLKDAATSTQATDATDNYAFTHAKDIARLPQSIFLIKSDPLSNTAVDCQALVDLERISTGYKTEKVSEEYETKEVLTECKSMWVSAECEAKYVSAECETMYVSTACEMEQVSSECETNQRSAECDTKLVSAACETRQGSADCKIKEILVEHESIQVSAECETHHMCGKLSAQCESTWVSAQCESNQVLVTCETRQIPPYCKIKATLTEAESMQVSGECETTHVSPECESNELSAECKSNKSARSEIKQMSHDCETKQMLQECETKPESSDCETVSDQFETVSVECESMPVLVKNQSICCISVKLATMPETMQVQHEIMTDYIQAQHESTPDNIQVQHQTMTYNMPMQQETVPDIAHWPLQIPVLEETVCLCNSNELEPIPVLRKVITTCNKVDEHWGNDSFLPDKLRVQLNTDQQPPNHAVFPDAAGVTPAAQCEVPAVVGHGITGASTPETDDRAFVPDIDDDIHCQLGEITNSNSETCGRNATSRVASMNTARCDAGENNGRTFGMKLNAPSKDTVSNSDDDLEKDTSDDSSESSPSSSSSLESSEEEDDEEKKKDLYQGRSSEERKELMKKIMEEKRKTIIELRKQNMILEIAEEAKRCREEAEKEQRCPHSIFWREDEYREAMKILKRESVNLMCALETNICNHKRARTALAALRKIFLSSWMIFKYPLAVLALEQASRYCYSRRIASAAQSLLNGLNAQFTKYGRENFLSVFHRTLCEQNLQERTSRWELKQELLGCRDSLCHNKLFTTLLDIDERRNRMIFSEWEGYVLERRTNADVIWLSDIEDYDDNWFNEKETFQPSKLKFSKSSIIKPILLNMKSSIEAVEPSSIVKAVASRTNESQSKSPRCAMPSHTAVKRDIERMKHDEDKEIVDDENVVKKMLDKVPPHLTAAHVKIKAEKEETKFIKLEPDIKIKAGNSLPITAQGEELVVRRRQQLKRNYTTLYSRPKRCRTKSDNCHQFVMCATNTNTSDLTIKKQVMKVEERVIGCRENYVVMGGVGEVCVKKEAVDKHGKGLVIKKTGRGAKKVERESVVDKDAMIGLGEVQVKENVLNEQEEGIVIVKRSGRKEKKEKRRPVVKDDVIEHVEELHIKKEFLHGQGVGTVVKKRRRMREGNARGPVIKTEVPDYDDEGLIKKQALRLENGEVVKRSEAVNIKKEIEGECEHSTKKIKESRQKRTWSMRSSPRSTRRTCEVANYFDRIRERKNKVKSEPDISESGSIAFIKTELTEFNDDHRGVKINTEPGPIDEYDSRRNRSTGNTDVVDALASSIVKKYDNTPVEKTVMEVKEALNSSEQRMGRPAVFDVDSCDPFWEGEALQGLAAGKSGKRPNSVSKVGIGGVVVFKERKRIAKPDDADSVAKVPDPSNVSKTRWALELN